MSKIKEVRIYVYDKDFLSFTFPDFLRKTGVEIEVDSHALHALHEIPKKIRTPLSVDPNARKPVTGWGLWIEEDFIIPWVVLVIINLIPFSTLIVGLVETSKHGPTWIALSAYGVTLSTFLFSQWVVMMKDSKR
ncbi:hypothetical protein B0J11DRAFT_525472 [Dendryphion nanum]|uniref:Uncharacterized protein n=1 Tax=Dendryphion nanum TaxID=256645 RepID=A0A9P9IN54_9PLEO|nr:hypothetical protein B0J11DRAFT_525472 [Dendryphion nanum]